MKFHKLISHIFHPILAPVVGTILFFIVLPRHTNKDLETTIIGAVFIGTYILPLIFLSFLKKSSVIQNFKLETVDERKFPILFHIALLYLLSTLIRKFDSTMELTLFFYGVQLSLLLCVFLLYRRFKVSLHMVGIGGLISFSALFSYYYQINSLLFLAAFFIIAGFIASARLYLNAHTKKEVYSGILIGVLGQVAVFITIYSI